MRALIAGALLMVAGACAGRQVEVRTGPQPAAEVTVRVRNNLSQPVNLYVASNGTDTFLKQVSANAVEAIPVRGFATGTTVQLKATTADGTHTYTRDNVTLVGTYNWQVP